MLAILSFASATVSRSARRFRSTWQGISEAGNSHFKSSFFSFWMFQRIQRDVTPFYPSSSQSFRVFRLIPVRRRNCQWSQMFRVWFFCSPVDSRWTYKTLFPRTQQKCNESSVLSQRDELLLCSALNSQNLAFPPSLASKCLLWTLLSALFSSAFLDLFACLAPGTYSFISAMGYDPQSQQSTPAWQKWFFFFWADQD